MSKMPLIYLEWEDSRSSDGWHDAEDTKAYFAKSTIVKQVGWVFSEDKRNICLVARIGDYMWNGSDDAANNTNPFSTCGKNAVAIPINRSDAPPKRNSPNATLHAFLAFTSLFWSDVRCDITLY